MNPFAAIALGLTAFAGDLAHVDIRHDPWGRGGQRRKRTPECKLKMQTRARARSKVARASRKRNRR